MKLNAKTIGIGIAILLILFITSAFIFQKTTTKSELVEVDGEQVFVELDSPNFFAKVVNFIERIFSNGFSVLMSDNTPKTGDSVEVIFSGTIDDQCQPTSGLITLSKNNIALKQWSVSQIPEPGKYFSYRITFTAGEPGQYKLSHALYGDLFFPNYGDCNIPYITDGEFCQLVFNSNFCSDADYQTCRNRMTTDNLMCATDLHYFNVEEVITDCPDSYCTDWEKVGVIADGDKYEQTCYQYGNPPSCTEYSSTKTKIVCDNGFVQDGNSCVAEHEDITCYQCSNGNVISQTFQDSCDSGWYSSIPSNCATTSTTTTSTTTTTQGNGMTGFAIGNLFDYEGHPTLAYSVLGGLAILIIAGIVLIPGRKK